MDPAHFPTNYCCLTKLTLFMNLISFRQKVRYRSRTSSEPVPDPIIGNHFGFGLETVADVVNHINVTFVHVSLVWPVATPLHSWVAHLDRLFLTCLRRQPSDLKCTGPSHPPFLENRSVIGYTRI